jgi:hypothetical protein
MDGVQWNSNKMYICPAIVDGQYADTHFEDDTSIEAFEEEATPVEMRSSEPMTVSILEITRPTKLKVLKGAVNIEFLAY